MIVQEGFGGLWCILESFEGIFGEFESVQEGTGAFQTTLVRLKEFDVVRFINS